MAMEIHFIGLSDEMLNGIREAASQMATNARAVLWHFNCEGGQRPGSFTESLIHTIALADKDNQNLLAQSFPDLVTWVYAVKNLEAGKDYVLSLAEKFEAVR
jgi:hypothetical protein